MKCVECKWDFESKRSTAKFCSERCKKRSQRVSGTKPVPVTLSGTEELVVKKTASVGMSTQFAHKVDDSIPVGEPQWPRSTWVKGAWHGIFCRCGESWCPNIKQVDLKK